MAKRQHGEERALALQARLAGFVMACTMLIWLGLQWIGGQLGWPPRFVFLFDFAALAAFIWALSAVWRVWRRRRDN